MKQRRKARLLRGVRALKKYSPTGLDIAWTALVALKESAEPFPPLKGVVGAVLVLWETANRVSGSKETAHALSLRCLDILYALANAVPEPSDIPPEMRASIRKFVKLLEEIREAMDRSQKRSWIKRLSRLNRDKAEFQKFNQRLDEACQTFTMAAALRTELNVSELRDEVATSVSRLEVQPSQPTARILIHMRFFLAM